MIIDCFTHTWESADQLGRCVPPQGSAGGAGRAAIAPSETSPKRHVEAAGPVDRTIVLGFESRHLDSAIPNDRVAQHVAAHADRLIGFAGIDPVDPKTAIDELTRAQEELNMPGLAIAPAAQGFHPTNSQAMLVYAAAADRNMPAVFHTGVFLATQTMLEYAQPVLLDEVAREFPEWRIIIAHLGYPWTSETIELLGKHPNVFAEISWILHQPWKAYQALLEAHQYGVIDKLLFGSGFPQATASECIEALYSINHLCQGTNLPTVPREKLRGIVERDTLALLGLQAATSDPESEMAASNSTEDELSAS